MKRSKKISAVMHKLLIEKGMDGFSVIEARDASLSQDGISSDLREARKQIYRQILRYEQKNWLRSEGQGQQKRYFQTAVARDLQNIEQQEAVEESTDSILTFETLSKERNTYQAELEISVGEVEEYQSLMSRFPQLDSKLIPLLKRSRGRSAHLLGKINGLTNVLEALKQDQKTC
ncbi:hypothetical protein DBZ36_16965 [Alginatibacterium sediminis]|uniref:Transcriptional regulator VspR n=1 Tax=Alginatibacterium sediminis TaxID=2164068 RepID=A0A420E7E7_9ALTE|nr:hypothetical protein [Alginatibacterium sediminis]RKF14348.1 hypothetical protein DBZ36_16965 [Alginatibacterium sediminis]